ncbi:MAG: hypothetical protein PHC54_05930 [Candidatus Omnitrophica bacterium]|nr:hypothetical protein [Candidatus Omnitrophota bacterium]MDD5592792.1 hypothetical protein [Candidatus Omnitrophota bacterium]
MADLFKELRGAKEIHIAAYLFNNPAYFSFLEQLASLGCKIKITSLPLSGYNNKKVSVNGRRGKVSPRHIAKQIYNKISSTRNMSLYIFPHLYAWYGALYADGGASFSFHVKAILASYKNDRTKCILSSGNFMFGDPQHSENLIVLESMPKVEAAFRDFFKDLEKYSVPYNIFLKEFNTSRKEFLFSCAGREIHKNKVFNNCLFTAPFYYYDEDGSNHYVLKRIINLIKKAKTRIWVCAQHFHDLSSFDPNASSVINAIYTKFCSSPAIEFRFLKQVPHTSLADKRRAAIAETIFQYVMHAGQKYNNLAHDKFMIIDNTLLISTANYTSTQFAFGLRKMEMGKGKGKIVKNDNFSEVNCFVIFPNCPRHILNQYIEHFNYLWDNGEEIKIEL